MAHNLPYTLSTDNTSVFNLLAGNAFLPSLKTPCEGVLANRYDMEKKNAFRETLIPYADLLKNYILSSVSTSKEEVLDKLRTAPYYDMSVKLFSYNFVTYDEPLLEKKRRQSSMTVEELRAEANADRNKKNLIREKEWESKISTYDLDSSLEIVSPMKINLIFQMTDIGLRLAAYFGPCFFPTYESKILERGDGFAVVQKTLNLRYYPHGLTKNQMQALLEAYKTEFIRENSGLLYKLANKEILKCNGILHFNPPLPPPPRIVRLLGPTPCHCGYHCDTDEE